MAICSYLNKNQKLYQVKNLYKEDVGRKIFNSIMINTLIKNAS